jgi:type I restriction enzyme R subunit
MLKNNPLRMEFYNRYKEIIEEYNNGKNLEDTVRSFNNLFSFIENLTIEDARAMRENLNEDGLAIFDLLRSGKTLSTEEIKEVKKIAVDTLEKLKTEKLIIDRWRESRQITAQIKTMIFDSFQWLPQPVYTDSDVADKTMSVYQHIYSNYSGNDLRAS